MQKNSDALFSAAVPVLAVLICFPETAYAYLDPGSGSFILQMLIAGILGALFYIKMTWERIKLFFDNLFSKEKQQPEEQQPEKQAPDEK